MKRVLPLIVIVMAMTALLFAMGDRESKNQSPSTPAAPASGVTGKIEIWEGNFMPMIDKEERDKQIRPGANLKVRLHEPATGLLGTVVATVPTPVVAEAVSDENGLFTIPAREGKYSLFIEDKNGWYANGWDGDGVQGAVVVEPMKMTEVLIKNTTKATF